MKKTAGKETPTKVTTKEVAKEVPKEKPKAAARPVAVEEAPAGPRAKMTKPELTRFTAL